MANIIAQRQYGLVKKHHWNFQVWRQWVFANALGEAIGLGAAALVGIWVASNMQSARNIFSIIFAAGVMILVGTFEGFVIGIAQSLILGDVIESFSKRAWIYATALGAFIAWALGMLPSTMMSLQEQTATESSPEISHSIMYGMAVLMGTLLGFILGAPQWMVLKRYVKNAWWWIPANALAWAFGMPLVFVAAGNEPPSNNLALVVWVLFVLAVVGVVVGAIHGLFLVWLLIPAGKKSESQ